MMAKKASARGGEGECLYVCSHKASKLSTWLLVAKGGSDPRIHLCLYRGSEAEGVWSNHDAESLSAQNLDGIAVRVFVCVCMCVCVCVCVCVSVVNRITSCKP